MAQYNVKNTSFKRFTYSSYCLQIDHEQLKPQLNVLTVFESVAS